MKPANTKTIFITGATDGIGKLTVLQLQSDRGIYLFREEMKRK